MPATRHKRSVFIFRAGHCPLRICPPEGSTCDCTPCPEPKRDRCQPLAGDISKYELAQRVRFPGLHCSGRPSQGCQDCREGEGLGAGWHVSQDPHVCRGALSPHPSRCSEATWAWHPPLSPAPHFVSPAPTQGSRSGMLFSLWLPESLSHPPGPGGFADLLKPLVPVYSFPWSNSS